MRRSALVLWILILCSSLLSAQISSLGRVEIILKEYPSAEYKQKLHLLEKLATIGALAKPSLSLLIQEIQSPHEKIRERALVALENLGPDAAPAIDVLIPALNDPSLAIAAQAAQCLGAIGPKARSAEKQLRARANSFGVYMLESSLKALGLIGADFTKTQPLLISAYANKSQDVRREAVVATAHLDSHGSRSLTFLEFLARDPSKWVRAATYDALAGFPEEVLHTVPLLIVGLQDKNYFVRMRAAHGLGTLGPLAHQGALPLAKSLKDTSHRVAIEAAKALRNMGSAGVAARQKVVNASKDAKGEMRRVLLETLKKM